MLLWGLAIATIVLIWVGISVHELGHAFACRRAGVDVTEVSLAGFPLPGIPSIRLPIESRRFPNTRWVVQPLLMGAYMQPDDAQMAALPRRERVRVLAMGPIASVVYGFGYLTLAAVLSATESAFFGCNPCLEDSGIGTLTYTFLVLAAGMSAVALGALCYVLRNRFWFHIVLLGLGCLLLPFFAWIIYTTVQELIEGAKPLHEIFPGPFALTQQAHAVLATMLDQASSVVLRAASSVALLVGGFSILVGIMNMTPCVAGDGTMILMEYLPHRIGRVIWWATLTIVGAFICIAVVGDAVVIWNWLRAGPA